MRSGSGGWVAIHDDSLRPSPKSMWLTSSTLPLRTVDPAGRPPIFFSAPARPSVWRVYCTAEASARYSRCRDTAALISRPASTPIQPAMRAASPTSIKGAALLPRSERPPARPLPSSTRPTTARPTIPASTPIRRMLRRMSPLTTWLNSCAITPCNSARLSRSRVPRVTATAALAGDQPAAKALMPGSCGSTYRSGTGVPDAIAISSTTLRSLRNRGSRVSSATRTPPRLSATRCPPPRRSSIVRTSEVTPISATATTLTVTSVPTAVEVGASDRPNASHAARSTTATIPSTAAANSHTSRADTVRTAC